MRTTFLCRYSPHVDSAARAHAKFGTPLNPKNDLTYFISSPHQRSQRVRVLLRHSSPSSPSTVDPFAYSGDAAAQSDGSARFQFGIPRRPTPFFSGQRTIMLQASAAVNTPIMPCLTNVLALCYALIEHLPIIGAVELKMVAGCLA